MTARYLLDTNIVSDLARHPQGRIAERIANVGEAIIATSVIVAAELRYLLLVTANMRAFSRVDGLRVENWL